jgi:hypothetical protein
MECIYILLLSHALLWLYLSSNSYFLCLLLHKTNSYVLRAWLASTLNKNTHREREREREREAPSADQLTKKTHPILRREPFMTRMSWSIEP